jgi:flagellar biogenesis protein FliO
MNGLLPPIVDHAVRARTVSGASQSFGALALIVLMLVLIEWELVRLMRGRTPHWSQLLAVAAPLLAGVSLTIVARLAPLLP